jgi:hypothetical protein
MKQSSFLGLQPLASVCHALSIAVSGYGVSGRVIGCDLNPQWSIARHQRQFLARTAKMR